MLPFIYDFMQDELKEIISPTFRVKQIWNWIYHKYIDDFEEMGNIPKDLKQQLKEKFALKPLEIVASQKSIDGSIKYLFRLHDGHTVEAVLLQMKDEEYHEDGALKHQKRYTVCISSQVGCKVGCAFCLTAKGGFVRNLSAGEIVAQLLMIKKVNEIAANRRVNIVYMGMGEPLDNLDNVVKAIKIFSDKDGMAISPNRQTLSTSGLSSKIEKLGRLDLGINLAISLHAVDDELREKLMPINKAYNIASIMDAVRNFPVNARKRVMFEYLVIKDVNDDVASAKKLLSLLNGIKAKVNLIYFNPYGGTEFQRPTPESMQNFQEYLVKRGQLCTIRESKGLDISAACGQLREQKDIS
ncbi:Ribosomal RNA large subunit methyltransferase N [Sulfurovum sp. enrichment culture clone C5]|uniref:Probable dual-specificity RNA methyltransferase RlmN n=1 Tax=Sulfurovum sp. enrichment culture clone C5 TaxID=497650 RepID=A0A0S4XPI5_9BACT|nr:Ribosomal RNA large subunit methyltransferase N [Sulfurovum sp. enrichment culture clone C5]